LIWVLLFFLELLVFAINIVKCELGAGVDIFDGKESEIVETLSCVIADPSEDP
jgi:hypothetical protein